MKADMKILGRPDLLPFPRSIVEPHDAQCRRNHYQTLDRVNERGGLSPSELVAVLEDRPWRPMESSDAIRRLTEIMEAAQP